MQKLIHIQVVDGQAHFISQMHRKINRCYILRILMTDMSGTKRGI